MLVDPLNLWFILLVTVSGFAVFTFLPSVLETLAPRDKGPRRILRKPLHEAIRRAAKLRYQSEPKPDEDTGISRDLRTALKNARVKSRRIGRNTVRVLGDIELKPGLEILEDIVIHDNLVVGEHCVLRGSIKAYGNVSVGSYAVIEGNLLSKRDIDLKNDVVIAGSVHADGSVRIGEKAYVGLSVVAGGDVELFENSEVKNILTRGLTKVLPSPKLDLPASMYRID